jgi:alpha-mannosidase
VLHSIFEKALAAGLLLACLCRGAEPARRIYIAPDDHTDYMWSGNEEEYRQAFVEMIDYYLDLAEKTAGNPPEHQSRWHCDGTIWFWTYEHNKPAADFKRLIERVRDGHVSVPLNALVSTYGGTPTEAVLRGMYYAGSLERRFNLRIPLAIAMENQTLPYGLGSLWAGSGAKQSWKGICGCLTKLNPHGKRPHEIYWWKGVDGSRILMKWNTLARDSGARTIGGYAEARTPGKEIEFVETNADFKAAYPYPVIGIFGKGWDDLKTLSDEFVTVAKDKTTPERQVTVSNINDFFDDFEKNYGSKLPEFSASFGNEWDLYTASVTEISARVRRAVEKLRSAEALSTLVSLNWPEFLNGRREARDQAWMNLGIFWEHNWTADGSYISRTERADWGWRIATGVERYVDRLYSDAAFALGGLIQGAGNARRLYVFNPLGWTRTDAADILYDGADDIHVIDLTTGQDAPFQFVRSPEETGTHRRRYLRVYARDLPPAGYKVFEIRPGKGTEFPVAATFNGSFLENSVYKLKVEDRGAISSLVDKMQGNREFASQADGRHSLNDLGFDIGTLQIESAGPVSVTLKAQGSGPLKHTSRITLYRDLRRIDIRNDINENFDGTYTWNFAFNLKNPDVHHEEVGAVIRGKLLADGGHYSPSMSRLEWLTLNHFADMSGEDGAGITLSNSDCAFMKLGDSYIAEGVSHLDTSTPQIQVLAGGQIDAPQAGIPKQGGESHFLQRFALQTHNGFSPSAAMKFSLEHQNPPVAGWVRRGKAYPETSYSLLTVSNPEVLLWSLKPAEDGPENGIITRVWNLSGREQSYSVSLATGIAGARRTTHIETDIEEVPVTQGRISTALARSKLQTLRLVPGNGKRP